MYHNKKPAANTIGAAGIRIGPSPSIAEIEGEPSWTLESANVVTAVTRRGGHLSPVVYRMKGHNFSVFASPPWSREPTDPTFPPVLQAMRGDFFCLPFGDGERLYRGERHPPHGESANAGWTCISHSARSLHLRLRTRVRSACVDKTVRLVDGHPAVYCRHVISGASGPMSMGHHAILHFAEEGVISTSSFALGQTLDGEIGDPGTGTYSSFKRGARFKSLQKVPTRFGGFTDASRFPNRAGFEDLLQLQSQAKTGLGWTAVVFPKRRFAWIGLKDTAVLPGTVMWFSNGGRHMPPWNGRHRNVVGLEEVCSYFHTGLARSVADNPHRRRGFKTCHVLKRSQPLTVNYIMAATVVPRGFDRVASVTTEDRGLTLVAANGKRQFVPIDTDFLWSGAAPAI